IASKGRGIRVVPVAFIRDIEGRGVRKPEAERKGGFGLEGCWETLQDAHVRGLQALGLHDGRAEQEPSRGERCRAGRRPDTGRGGVGVVVGTGWPVVSTK